MEESVSSSEKGGRPWWKSPVIWARVFAISVLCTVLFFSHSRHVDQAKLESTFPPFELPLLDGGKLRSSELAGKVVVLNFFASWCAPCKAEMPEIIKYSSEVDPKKVRVIGVAAGQEHRLDIRSFVKAFGVPFPVALDGELLLMKVGSDGLPTTVVLDPEGHVTQVTKGQISKIWLEREVARALAHGSE